MVSLESERSTITSVSAGVQTAFHYRTDRDQCETLRSESMPLGVFDGTDRHPPLESRMESGDVFAVASDGVMELGGNDAASGSAESLIVRTLQKEHTNSAGEIVEALNEAIKQATRSAPSRARTARGERSSRLPIGVATT